MKYVTSKINKINNHIKIYVGEEINILVKILIYVDILYSIIRYGMNLDEYFQYNFFGKRHNERKNYIVYRKRMKIVENCNSTEDMRIFDNKPLFNKEFSEFVNRKWLNVQDSSYGEFVKFTKSCKEFFVKPTNGYFGLGIRKETIDDNVDLRNLYDNLIKEGALLEEIIEQLDGLSEFNPTSVNSLRVVTLYHGKGKIKIMTANLRMGNGLDKYADNFHYNGIAALIDIDTGIVKTTGIDRYLNTYVKHPVSEKQIVGYVIPNWDKVKETVKKAALVKPTVGYVGWDVALGKDGSVIIIEGNCKADPDVSQLPDGIGKWPLYDKLISNS